MSYKLLYTKRSNQQYIRSVIFVSLLSIRELGIRGLDKHSIGSFHIGNYVTDRYACSLVLLTKIGEALVWTAQGHVGTNNYDKFIH